MITPRARRRTAGLVALVTAVPLAVAGLVAAALGGVDERLDTIPAIVVNHDEMVTVENPDGTEQPVLAGRLLVTELTAPEGAGFDWSLSSADEAERALADGTAYAVLEIPEDFSASVTSLSGDRPERAELELRTDDAHAYLTGSLAQSVGEAMTAAFGRELTEQYLTGLYGGLAEFGEGIASASTGATELATGASGLATGLDELATGASGAATGAADAAAGAADYADGVRAYTEGVDGLAGGLGELAAGTSQLSELGAGVSGYVAGVRTVDDQLAQIVAGLQLAPAGSPQQAALLDGLAQLSREFAAANDAPEIAGLTAGAEGLGALETGIADAASGAAQLSAGSAPLRSGGDDLAAGLDELAAGLATLATGAADAAGGGDRLAAGAGELSTGLASGADEAAAFADVDADETAGVASEPVVTTTSRENAIDGVAPVIGMLVVPVGLWIGAMALTLVFRPFGRQALASTASTGALVARASARAIAVGIAQAVAVVALLHAGLGVAWSSLPATLAFSIVVAVAFTALHLFLAAWLGRVGAIVSLVLLAVQLAASGALYPVEVLSAPFAAISPALPLTWAVDGLQAIVSGSGGGDVVAASALLVLVAVAATALTAAVVAGRRGIRSTALVPAT